MNKRVKKLLLIAAGIAAAAALVWGGMTLAKNAQRSSVNVYAVSDFSMSDYWGDTSQTSGMVTTDEVQKIFLSKTQKVKEVFVEEGQSVKKGDRLLSYDTTLTALDVERAQIAYEKQQLKQETLQKELELLKLAFDKDALEDEIASLNRKIDTLIAQNIKNWESTTTKPVMPIAEVETPTPLTKDGSGTKESPLYFDWHSEDALTQENLTKLLPEDLPEEQKSVYVVLVIHEDDMTLGAAFCFGLQLELVEESTTEPTPPTTPATPEEGAEGAADPAGDSGTTPQADPPVTDPATSTEPTEPTETTEPTDPAAPAATRTVRLHPAELPEYTIPTSDGITDEVRRLKTQVDSLTSFLENAYSKAEMEQMEREKLKELAELEVTLKLAKLELEQTKLEVGSDTVYSTLDGTVKAVRDSASAEFDISQPVVEVSGGGGYYIEGALSELELGTVSVGSTVQINSWMTGASCEGEIVEISDYPTENANSWSDGNNNVSYYPFKVFVSDEADLREGDWVDMSYQNTAEGDENALYLENMFLRTESGKSYVMARGEDGRLEKRWVQTGRSLWGSYTQIRGGLTAEDFVAFPYGVSVAEGAQTVEATPEDLYNGM